MPEQPRSRSVVERCLESILFNSWWLLAPFYLGLVLALAMLLIAFLKKLAGEVTHIPDMDAEHVILLTLSLIDLSLAGNLILIVIFSGYENFVSRFDTVEDGPAWMGRVDFSGLKLKLVSSITAISGVELLRAFMRIGVEPLDGAALKWRIGVLLTFVVSGVLLAVMDFVSARTRGH